MDFDILTKFAILVPVTIGVVQAVKMVGLPVRFAPLASLVVGIGGAYFLIGGDAQIVALQGVIAGLMASGLWSGTRTTFNV